MQAKNSAGNNRLGKVKNLVGGLSPRHLLTYFVLGFGYPGVIGFVYLQYVYYDVMIEVMQITNTQLGLLATIVAAVAVVLALPCGILIDRFDCKKILCLSFAVTAIGAVVYALAPTYTTAIITWSILAVSMCGFYPAVFKILRIVAPKDKQGSSFGIFAIFNAIGFITVNSVSLQIFTNLSETMSIDNAFSVVLWIFAGVLTVAATVGYFLLKDLKNPEEEASEVSSFSLKDLIAVLKMPGTWLIWVVSFSVNSLHIVSSYLTPYFTSVLGTTVAFAGFLAIFRQYGVRIISAPLGGILGDKLKSNTKIIMYSTICIAVIIGVFMVIPAATPIAILITIVLAFAFFDNLNISLCYSIFEDARIPRFYMGTALGVVQIILPDLFEYTLFGYWLDTYGNFGYTLIFIFAIVMCITAVAGAIVIIRLAKKRAVSKGGELPKE